MQSRTSQLIAFLAEMSWIMVDATPEQLHELITSFKEHDRNDYAGTTVKHYEASRHSFCTQIVESGASEFEAQMLMRHKDPRSTRKYFHGRMERLRAFVNKRSGNVVPLPDRNEIGTTKKGKK